MQPNILGNFLGQARITKLSEEDRLSFEGLITIEECVKALDNFEKGKNPDFFPPLVIKGNAFVYFNKGKHTSFASRVYENGRGRLRVLRPFRAMSKKKQKKKNQRKQNLCKQVAESYEKSRSYFSCASHPEVRAAILV